MIAANALYLMLYICTDATLEKCHSFVIEEWSKTNAAAHIECRRELAKRRRGAEKLFALESVEFSPIALACEEVAELDRK